MNALEACFLLSLAVLVVLDPPLGRRPEMFFWQKTRGRGRLDDSFNSNAMGLLE